MTLVPGGLDFWGITPEELESGEYSDSPKYKAIKDKIMEDCIEQFATIIPNLREHIVYKEACSPLTHQRYIRSSNGTSYGFSMEAKQFFKRPGSRSPISGLYMCGANCASGHGIVGAITSGNKAAHAVMSVG